MINCLLAGSTGVIGSEIKKINNINYIYINRKETDLTNYKKSEEYVKKLPKINVLIFLVGLAHRKGKKNDYNDHMSLNYSTLYNLLSIMEMQNSLPDKIIFTSTISVYGENKNMQVYNETANLNPISPYARTKKCQKII